MIADDEASASILDYPGRGKRRAAQLLQARYTALTARR
jgi:hypothetical protein